MIISKVYGGRSSDEYITKSSGFYYYIPPTDQVMADWGFTFDSELGARHATLGIPSFTKGNSCQNLRWQNVAWLHLCAFVLNVLSNGWKISCWSTRHCSKFHCHNLMICWWSVVVSVICSHHWSVQWRYLEWTPLWIITCQLVNDLCMHSI